MPRMVITHAVVDVERWLKGEEERAGRHKQSRRAI